jgi:hypothetical protein
VNLIKDLRPFFVEKIGPSVEKSGAGHKEWPEKGIFSAVADEPT